MTALALAKSLSAIWYVIDTEDENKKPIVERREVKSLFINFFEGGENLSSIFDCISDEAGSCEVDEFIYGGSEVIDNMLATCNERGHLAVEDVIQSQLDAQEFDVEEHYVDLCHRLGTALGIDTSDNKTNSSFWGVAYEDGLTPIQAVKDSIK
tara:strand:- start:266 stop:724 length:459 start_codon:yes stop_codon:yes gene_type:complete